MHEDIVSEHWIQHNISSLLIFIYVIVGYPSLECKLDDFSGKTNRFKV